MTDAHETAPNAHALPDLVAAVPVLQTKRLTLRAPHLDDFPVLLEINDSVSDVSLRTGGRTGAWQDFMQMTAIWLLRGHGWWSVDDADGIAGFVGLGFEPGDQAPELGYLFLPRARGKGYATEAAIAARDAARDLLKLPELISYISDDNVASQSVARKLGANRDAATEAALGEDGVQVWRHWGVA